MAFIPCKECGMPADVFDDGWPFCSMCYDKIVEENMEKNRVREKIDGEVNVPYAVQRRLLYATFDETVEWMREMLKNNEFLDEVEEMAAKRLAEGYEKYGSKMYSWDSETRDRNILEELADAFVYKSSGDV